MDDNMRDVTYTEAHRRFPKEVKALLAHKRRSKSERIRTRRPSQMKWMFSWIFELDRDMKMGTSFGLDRGDLHPSNIKTFLEYWKWAKPNIVVLVYCSAYGWGKFEEAKSWGGLEIKKFYERRFPDMGFSIYEDFKI